MSSIRCVLIAVVAAALGSSSAGPAGADEPGAPAPLSHLIPADADRLRRTADAGRDAPRAPVTAEVGADVAAAGADLLAGIVRAEFGPRRDYPGAYEEVTEEAAGVEIARPADAENLDEILVENAPEELREAPEAIEGR